jgi:protein TonB
MVRMIILFLVLAFALSVAAAPADDPPRLLKRVEPECTALAKQVGAEGTVTLAYTIFEDGVPANIVVVKGMDYDLNHEAAKALAQWRYTPGKRDGKPARFTAATELKFNCSE